MYGWRSRIGLIIPSANTTMEPEFYRMAPEGVSIHTSRVLLERFDEGALSAMEQEVERAARELKTAGVDMIVFGCTAAGFVKEGKGSPDIARKIEGILGPGKRVVTTAEAVIEALRALNCRRIGVATPYPDSINERQRLFFEERGIAVTKMKGLGLAERIVVYPLTTSPVSPIGLQEPYVAYRLGREVNTPEAEAIFISCTHLRTIEILARLERDLGKPVLSSNQATLAIALKKAGIRERIAGYGSLFDCLAAP